MYINTLDQQPYQMIVDKDITLKMIDLNDEITVFETINNNQKHLKEWLPFINDSFDIEHVKSFIENAISSESNDQVFTINYKDQFVGIISLKDIDELNQKTEIGYWLSESYQHKGIITKSCNKLIQYAFKNLHMNRIQLRIAKRNIKSQAVAIRLGFIREGIERDGELHADEFVDLFVYSLLKNDSSPFSPV